MIIQNTSLKQFIVMDFYITTWRDTQNHPSSIDAAKGLGYKHGTAITHFLNALEKKGFLKRRVKYGGIMFDFARYEEQKIFHQNKNGVENV